MKRPASVLKKPAGSSKASAAADKAAEQMASRPVSAQKGGQKQETLMKKPAARKSSKEDLESTVRPKFGKLSVTKASLQSYIQYKEGGSKKLLIGVSADAAKRAGLDHKAMIDVILQACIDNGLDKPNATSFRDSFLKDGNPPF